jgi:hypothetical protein
MNWEIEIEKVSNGYVVTEWTENDVGESVIEQQTVIEEPETATGDIEAMQNLLWFVKEHFGVMYSKHNKRNLVVEIQDNEEAD